MGCKLYMSRQLMMGHTEENVSGVLNWELAEFTSLLMKRFSCISVRPFVVPFGAILIDVAWSLVFVM
jgi:hypothetical protein